MSGGMSPLHPPAFPSSSDFEGSDGDEEDEEDLPGCYSPATFDSEAALPSCSASSPPPRKKVKLDREPLCCETDLKMLWLKLGQSGSKDYYENWPEFIQEDGGGGQSNPPHNAAIYLLLKLSWLDETPVQLTDRSTVKAIIDYLVETPRPIFRACQILFRLASHPGLFVGLLRTHFPLEVYVGLNRKAAQHVRCCPLHSSLRRVGEQILDQMASLTGQFGRGEMEKILLEGVETGPVALAAPLIVKSRSLLRRFLTELGVLDAIARLLCQEESRTYATASLSALAAFLKMDDLMSPAVSLSDLFHHGDPCRASEDVEDVFFLVQQDQSVVGGVKSRLQGSSYFQAMFRGGFNESLTDRIPMPGIQARVLLVVLHVAYGCGCQCAVIRGIEELIRSEDEEDMRPAVELLASLDRFLLLDELESLSGLIANQDWAGSPKSFASLWNFLAMDQDDQEGVPYSTKLRSHLRYYPFSGCSSADLPSRVRIVEALMKEAEGSSVVSGWKRMFLARLVDQ